MLDPLMRRIIDPPLNFLGRVLARRGMSANMLTFTGFGLGMAAMAFIAMGFYGIGLLFLMLNRLSDGLDGAVARATQKTDLGGFLDIVLDFIVYAGIVLGFAFAVPERNALYAALLLFAFMGTASSFLAFAIFAARHGLETQARGAKSLYYLGGLAEGTETFLFFIAFCLWPQYFPHLSVAFAIICFITTFSRIAIGFKTLRGLG